VGVTGIVVGMNMMRLNAVLEGPALSCFDRLIRHSIATAFLARHLVEGVAGRGPAARPLPVARVGVSFTAGLLHDFGKIILVYNFPTEGAELYERRRLEAEFNDPDVRAIEQLIFGCDHTEAGEFVARKLGFPEALIDVIRFHHDPQALTGTAETDQLVRATAAANLAAKAMGYGIAAPDAWETVVAHPAWKRIVEQDLPGLTPAGLAADVQRQREKLDQYVSSLLTPDATGKKPRAAGGA
ncbi:MAG: HDOD domain-containing protein, partial [Rhodothermales bacterium]|nr:HDOD domain-containing protein [Rhodothermales bacterium]